MGIEHVLLWVMVFAIIAIGVKERNKGQPYKPQNNGPINFGDVFVSFFKFVVLLVLIGVQIAWLVTLFKTLPIWLFLIVTFFFAGLTMWPMRLYYRKVK